MKRLLFLLAILLAIGASLAIANESNGPPGVITGQYTCPVDTALSPVAVQVPKEFNAVGLEAVLVSNYADPDVALGFPRPVIGLALVAEKNALDKYLTVQSDNRPSLGAVA